MARRFPVKATKSIRAFNASLPVMDRAIRAGSDQTRQDMFLIAARHLYTAARLCRSNSREYLFRRAEYFLQLSSHRIDTD